MNTHKFLERFHKLLAGEQLDCTLANDRLLVFFGLDDKNRERVLEISCIEQTTYDKIPGAHLFRVQLLTELPFKIQPNAVSQVASLVCYLNKIIEIHGFEMDEVSLGLAFRHVFLYGEKELNQKLLTSLLGIVMLIVDLFSASMEKIASGERTFNQLLEEILKLVESQKTD